MIVLFPKYGDSPNTKQAECLKMTYLERGSRLRDPRATLKNNHNEIRRQLWILGMLVSRGDYDLAEKRILELWTFLDSHFAREESRVREIVTVSPSLSSSINESTTTSEVQIVESLVREHRAISDSFKQVQYLTRFSTDSERFSCFGKFETALLNCLSHEESALLFEKNKEFQPRIAEEIKAQDLVLLA